MIKKLPLHNEQCLQPTDSVDHSQALTYEKKSTVCYACGCKVRAIRKHLKILHDDNLLLGLSNLCNTDDDIEPAESEEWLALSTEVV